MRSANEKRSSGSLGSMFSVRDVRVEDEETPLKPRTGFSDEFRGAYSSAVCVTCLGLIYSVHNIIAPNLTAIAKFFNMTSKEKDELLGGQLTLYFYIPGIVVSLIFGYLSSFVSRKALLTTCVLLTAIPTFATAWVTDFQQLLILRTTAGVGLGGALPVVYSLLGDWFPPSRRTTASAYASMACGIGVLLGQFIASSLGSTDWRRPFIFVAVPLFVIGVVWQRTADEPEPGRMEVEPVPESASDSAARPRIEASSGDGLSARDSVIFGRPTTTSARGASGGTGEQSSEEQVLLRAGQAPASADLMASVSASEMLDTVVSRRTNFVVLLQAFPGNVPWAVVMVYLSDFFTENIKVSRDYAMWLIALMALFGFLGVMIGGLVGQALYNRDPKWLALFCAVCNVTRSLPMFFLFGWPYLVGPASSASTPDQAKPDSAGDGFVVLVCVAGFVSTLSASGLGAILLNINIPETRGTVCALYTALDDVSKGVGAIVVSQMVTKLGSRELAYQLALLAWIFSGALLLFTRDSFPQDEAALRKHTKMRRVAGQIEKLKRDAKESIRKHTRSAIPRSSRI